MFFHLLGNYQKTLNDAEAAVTLQPTFIEAFEKGKFLTTIFWTILVLNRVS